MRYFSVQTSKFKCSIEVKNNIIKRTGPYLKQFENSPIGDLIDWLDFKYTDDYHFFGLNKEPKEEFKDV